MDDFTLTPFDYAEYIWTRPRRVFSMIDGDLDNCMDRCIVGAVRHFGAVFIAAKFPQEFFAYQRGDA